MSEVLPCDKRFYANGVLLIVYITLKPIYLWSSGSVQLCDIVLLLGIALNLLRIKGKLKFRKSESRYVKVLAALCVFQTFVNFVWSVKLNDNILKPSLFYFFNLFAVCLFILIIDEIGIKLTKQCIVTGSFISLLVTAVSIVVTAGTKRSTGFFNNPNQLGYFALLLLGVVIICWSEAKPAVRMSIIILAVFAIIASSSKAAFAGMVATFVFYVLSQGTKLTYKKIILQASLVLFVGVLLYWFLFSENSILLSNASIVRMRYRMLHLFKENDSDLGTARGYDRIYEMGNHILWGKGEGAYYRFNSLRNAEAHSTFVSLYVSYGLIGFLGYMYLFFKAIYRKNESLRNFAILSGPFVYQLTHNGIRNTLFWLLIVLVLVEKSSVNAPSPVFTPHASIKPVREPIDSSDDDSDTDPLAELEAINERANVHRTDVVSEPVAYPISEETLKAPDNEPGQDNSSSDDIFDGF